MIEQLKTIRAGLETATCYSMLGVDAHSVQLALTALTLLEAMVGEQEPVVWIPPQDGRWHWSDSVQAYRTEKAGWVPVFAAPVAQQPQARPDFTDEWAGYLKDGETPFERFLRERKDLQSVLKLYQRVLEENERLKGQQPQAEAASDDLRDRLVAISAAIADQDDRAAQAMIREILAAPQQAEAVPDLVRDAERYRWLRDQNADLDAGFYVGDETDKLPEEITWVGSDLDAAIDAAIAQQKGGV